MISVLLASVWGFLTNNIIFFACYISSGNTFPPPLSKAEEAKLITMLDSGSKEARDKLIEHNLRLVAHIAKKYTVNGHDADDLLSIGTIGLIKGVSNFSSAKKTKLSTFLAKCIQNEILMYLRSGKKLRHEILLSNALGGDSEGNELTFNDIISDEDESVINEVAHNLRLKALYDKIGDVLTKREVYIISRRYGLFGYPEQTQNEIAESLDISRSYVSRIEKKAIEKLREALGIELPEAKSE